MKRLIFFALPLMLFLTGCSHEFQAGVIAGAAQHIFLVQEFDRHPGSDGFLEDYCQYFRIELIPTDEQFQTWSYFQFGAWLYLVSIWPSHL